MTTATITTGVSSSSEDTHPAAARGLASARGRRVLVLVLVLVNSAAVWGQAGWAVNHIVPAGWHLAAGIALALAFAVALESIGIFLATMADEADAAGLPSGGIRAGSYAVGVISGALNFSHWSGVLAAAITFGLLSGISPFLWGIYSRVRRGRQVPPSRRLWHPRRSISLIRFMAWEGIADEAQALQVLEFRKSPEDAPTSPGTGVTKEEIGRMALDMKTETGLSWEKIAAELGYSPAYLFKCRKAAENA